jgi:hypothetical protein
MIAVACKHFDRAGFGLTPQVHGSRSQAQLNSIGWNLQVVGQLADRLAFQEALKHFHGKRMIHDGT